MQVGNHSACLRLVFTDRNSTVGFASDGGSFRDPSLFPLPSRSINWPLTGPSSSYYFCDAEFPGNGATPAMSSSGPARSLSDPAPAPATSRQLHRRSSSLSMKPASCLPIDKRQLHPGIPCPGEIRCLTTRISGCRYCRGP
jgi:hypothetical protein